MRVIKVILLGVLEALIWPLYLVLAAYTARVGPWPRGLGALASAMLSTLALGVLVFELIRLATRPEGWLAKDLDLPVPVARQLGRVGRFTVAAAVLLLAPVYLIDHGLIAPEGRAVSAPTLARVLVIGFELAVWFICVRLLRSSSALLVWLGEATHAERTDDRGSRFLRGMAWMGRRRRLAAWIVLAGIAAVAVLEVRGYSFTARRLAIGGFQTTLVLAFAVALHHALARAIDDHAWRWPSPRRSWAKALKNAVTLGGSTMGRGAWSSTEVLVTPIDPDAPADDDPIDDLELGLRRLSVGLTALVALMGCAWVWDFNLALAKFLLDQTLWSFDEQNPVTLGNLCQATIVMLLGATAWRYMNTFFSVTLFRRVPDDPGVRFAIVTLCRYGVLGLALIIAMGAIHLDMARIGVVLAALGVGLGFGLQEIVSNFVCGIILLLERPIRIGDVVTVAGTSGKVDRINIRATTIINADNQCMIVPNREFITGNLVNWTHKDKIMRVPIKLGVAYGNDPDHVVEVLLEIARGDVDVLAVPAPGAALEDFGDSALLFGLSVFVAEPGLVGKTRHRLCAAIQRKFTELGIVMPYPTHELHVSRVPHDLTQALSAPARGIMGSHRADTPSHAPPPPHVMVATTSSVTAESPLRNPTVD